MIIPKEIREKIELRNKINAEIASWCEENLDIDGCDPNYAYIVEAPKGEKQILQHPDEEYCNQRRLGEDWYQGEYYWKMDNGKYLCMDFEI